MVTVITTLLSLAVVVLIFVLNISAGTSSSTNNNDHVCDASHGANKDGSPATSTSSSEKWAWDLDAEHRCNVERIDRAQLFERFGPRGLPSLYHEPVVVTGIDNDALRRRSDLSGIVEFFSPTFPITLSSSNSFSDHRRTVALEEYLNTTLRTETLPSHLSNASWYFFGETFSAEWRDFLSVYDLPPCRSCDDRDSVALSFGVGNKGSGVQWHTHGPGFSESIHGRKHWVLYPPDRKPDYDANFTSRRWMEEEYSRLLSSSSSSSSSLPWECTVHPGEVVYFPAHWHHATINLDVYTVFVSTFTTER